MPCIVSRSHAIVVLDLLVNQSICRVVLSSLAVSSSDASACVALDGNACARGRCLVSAVDCDAAATAHASLASMSLERVERLRPLARLLNRERCGVIAERREKIDRPGRMRSELRAFTTTTHGSSSSWLCHGHLTRAQCARVRGTTRRQLPDACGVDPDSVCGDQMLTMPLTRGRDRPTDRLRWTLLMTKTPSATIMSTREPRTRWRWTVSASLELQSSTPLRRIGAHDTRRRRDTRARWRQQ